MLGSRGLSSVSVHLKCTNKARKQNPDAPYPLRRHVSPSSMSASGWFDMFTGVVSLVVVFCGMLQQLLPSTWLSLLEDSLKDVETSIRVAGEEGLLPIDTALFIRLTELRRDFDQLAVRVYAAGNWFQQFLEMLKGLTCKLSVVHKSVSAVKAEIASLRAVAWNNRHASQWNPPSQRRNLPSAIWAGRSFPASLRYSETSTNRSVPGNNSGPFLAAVRPTPLCALPVRRAISPMASRTTTPFAATIRFGSSIPLPITRELSHRNVGIAKPARGNNH